MGVKGKDTLLACPLYNEQDTVGDLFENVRNYYRGDTLFINDGSTDNSIANLCAQTDACTYIVSHPHRKGYGAALKTGFMYALDKGYKRIVTIDGDLQHNPARIPQMFQELREWEVVLGSRYIRINNCVDIPRQRLLINRYISSLIEVVFSLRFTDPFCGLRAYRETFLKKARITETSYGAALEILLEIVRTNAVWKEIPVEAIYFPYRRKFLDGLDNPRQRLLYYLKVISKIRKGRMNEEKIFNCESPSR